MPEEYSVYTATVEYTDFETEYGSIRVHHEMTFGDLAVSTLLAVLIVVIALSTLLQKMWED